MSTNHIQITRVMMMEDAFQRTITGAARGTYAAFEAQALPLAKELLPLTGPVIHKAVIRLITLFVKDPKGLVDFIAPRHLDFLMTYRWLPETNPELAEGASSHWLFRGSNDHLRALESAHTGGFLPFLHPTVQVPFAVRAWIRIQAMLMDTDKLSNIIEIANLYRKNPASDFLPNIANGQVNPENFELLPSEADAKNEEPDHPVNIAAAQTALN